MRTENAEVFVSAQDLRESSTDELLEALKEAEENLLRIREEAAVGATRLQPDYEKPHIVKGHRKLIARIKTILRERQ